MPYRQGWAQAPNPVTKLRKMLLNSGTASEDTERIKQGVGRASRCSATGRRPLTRAAIFLVVTLKSGEESEAAARALCGDLAGLLRAVGFRDLEGRLSCVMAFGSDAWDRLFGDAEAERAASVPRDPRPPPRRRDARRHAVPYPRGAHGSVLRTGDADHVAARRRRRPRTDEVHGFKYFDDRDLMGFVDGTENPVGSGRDRRHDHRRGGRGLCRRQLCHRAEISARPDGWNKLPVEAAGEDHRPDQAVGHRTAR